MSRFIEEVWARDGFGARLLTPLSLIYRTAIGIRNLAFDRGLLVTHDLDLPAVSVGNLTVGGTGKTPVASWIAGQLAAQGARPAILLRGYGADEPMVHQQLLPQVRVVADPDRVRGARRAREAGATVLVLDDAFQHRRAKRDLDLVLIAAEQASARRLLPAGPLREAPSALARADHLIVTRKSASAAQARAVAQRVGSTAGIPWAVVHLRPGSVREWGGDAITALETLTGSRVLAVSAVGDPGAFEAQLAHGGVRVTGDRYPDHHPFSDAEVARIAEAATRVDQVICTLKDAVKLGPRWPRNGPRLWYLSQAVEVEEGEAPLLAALARLVPPKH